MLRQDVLESAGKEPAGVLAICHAGGWVGASARQPGARHTRTRRRQLALRVETAAEKQRLRL
eukprot:6405092-Alexandrium_andersonii.AAC.1